jgi:rare lipoprotein A
MVASNGKMTADQLPDYAPTPFRQPTRKAVTALPLSVPTPSMAYAGATPVMPAAKAQPAMAWAAPEPAASAFPVLLPQIGPIPRDRPDFGQGVAQLSVPSLAAAYGEPEASRLGNAAFEKILVARQGLTAESILAAYRKHAANGKVD